ncbi:unnamed protein product, partial [Gulo gulo]
RGGREPDGRRRRSLRAPGASDTVVLTFEKFRQPPGFVSAGEVTGGFCRET